MARKGYRKKGYGEEGIWRGRDMARKGYGTTTPVGLVFSVGSEL